jgi:hypothetical protein
MISRRAKTSMKDNCRDRSRIWYWIPAIKTRRRSKVVAIAGQKIEALIAGGYGEQKLMAPMPAPASSTHPR